MEESFLIAFNTSTFTGIGAGLNVILIIGSGQNILPLESVEDFQYFFPALLLHRYHHPA